MLRPLDLALLRLESSSKHGPHWRILFLAKSRPGGQQLMQPNYCALFALAREPFGSDLAPKGIMRTAEVLGVAKRFE
ncbi:hypothetical protein DFAR_3460069 [Desulfarculales bacterium]